MTPSPLEKIPMTTTTSSPKSVKSSPRKSVSPIKPTEPVSPSNNKNSKPHDFSRPSAEDLVDLERELQRLISRKLQADTNLIKVETRLFDLETEYLTDTQSFGNLIHGIEGYLGLPPSVPATSTISNAPIRRGTFNNSTSNMSQSASLPQQRLFSSTSTTFQKSLALAGRLNEAVANGYSVPNSSTEGSSDLTLINGLRTKSHDSQKSASRNRSSSSPTKKNSGSSSKPSSNGNGGVNKNKKSTDSAEWQPPSMKSSRKK